MAESHVISGLKAKQEEIRRRIAELEKSLQAARRDLSAISQALRVFDDPEAYVRPKKLFARGDVSRTIFDALRTAPDGLTIKTITEAVMKKNGIDIHDVGSAATVRKRVENAMYRYLGKGVLVKSGSHNRAYVWKMAGRAQ